MPPKLYACDPAINCSCLPGTPVSRRTVYRHFAEAVALHKTTYSTGPVLKRARVVSEELSSSQSDIPDIPSGDPGEYCGDADHRHDVDAMTLTANVFDHGPSSSHSPGEELTTHSTETQVPQDDWSNDVFFSPYEDIPDYLSLSESEQSHEPIDANMGQAPIGGNDIGEEKLKETSQKWKDIILWQDRHHITRPAMDDLLKILASSGIFPLATWQTIRNNLQRASGLVSKYESLVEKIPYCSGHMLLNRPGLSTSSFPHAHVASVCSQPNCSRSEPSGLFETLPITPRISALWKDKKCREMLYETASIREKQMNDAEQHGMYEDVASGAVYRQLVADLGGPDAVRTDIFLAFSTDGFQVYEKSKVSATVAGALCLNFPPDLRYMIDNLITVAVVPGPREPKCLESFLVPFYREVETINNSGGIKVRIEDEGRLETICSRVHIVHVTGDLQALPKFCGNIGPSGLNPCHFCCAETSRQFGQGRNTTAYFPSVGYGRQIDGNARRNLFDPANPPLRTKSSYDSAYSRLQCLRNTPGGTVAAIDEERTESGVNFRPILCSMSQFSFPYSVPLDTMHLIYINVLSRILHIYTGNEACCSRVAMESERVAADRTRLFSFILEETSIDCIDESYDTLSPTCIFRTLPRDFARTCLPFRSFKSWKAIVGKEFILYYGTALMYGHLRKKHLKGWIVFRKLTELLNRTVLAEEDIARIESLAVDFVRYLEKEVTLFRPDRAQVMRLVIHLLLHLGSSTRSCGPLVNLSQFWLERLIGSLTERLHAKSKPATSMTKAALHRMATVVTFPERLLAKEAEPAITTKLSMMEDAEGRVDTDSLFRAGRDAPLLLSKNPQYHLHDDTPHRREDVRLLSKYLRAFYDDGVNGRPCRQGDVLDGQAATLAITRASAKVFDRVLLSGGGDPADAIRSARSILYENDVATRPDFYVAVGQQEAAEAGAPLQISYSYGKVLQLILVRTPICNHTNSLCRDEKDEHILALIQPAKKLHIDRESDIVYTKSNLESAFLTPRYVDTDTITHKIGVVQASARESASKWTYFIDPQRTRLGMLGGPPCAGESGEHTLDSSW